VASTVSSPRSLRVRPSTRVVRRSTPVTPVGLDNTIVAVACVFWQQLGVVRRQSDTHTYVRRGLVFGGSGARRG
jgi:hypothetical protein